MLLRKPNRRSGVILTDVIAPAGVLRLVAGRERPRICQRMARGNAMISSRNARRVANLAIASALTILLAACSSMSLPSLSSSSAPEVETGVAPDMPATIRSDDFVGADGRGHFGRNAWFDLGRRTGRQRWQAHAVARRQQGRQRRSDRQIGNRTRIT